MAESCATCRFALVPEGNTAAIECRRRAPAYVPLGQRMCAPTLPPAYWCGEWEARAAAREELNRWR